MDALLHLDVKIDTRSGQLSLDLDGRNVPGSAWENAERKSIPVKMVKYGKVYAVRSDVIAPNQEHVLWGTVCTSEAGEWTSVLEVTSDVTEK